MSVTSGDSIEYYVLYLFLNYATTMPKNMIANAIGS